jgi:hypothetical protein
MPFDVLILPPPPHRRAWRRWFGRTLRRLAARISFPDRAELLQAGRHLVALDAYDRHRAAQESRRKVSIIARELRAFQKARDAKP